MFVVDSLGLAIFFCVLTMLGWGSWANTQKLAGRSNWPFQLFYWDYAIGVALFGLLFAITLGSFGAAGMGSWQNLQQAAIGPIGWALLSGAVFNASNILLVVAIDMAGMSVAFPVGVGLALVIGTVSSYMQAPKGNPWLLFSGVGAIVIAMVFAAIAYQRLPQKNEGNWRKGLFFAVVAGLLMGFFYPQLMRAISGDFNTVPTQPGMLTPYVALFIFGIGVAASNLLFNTIFMKSAGLGSAQYFSGGSKLHWIGILGGSIWMLALSLNVLASGVAGPAISYALGQGATLVAAIWGVFVWKEFALAPPGTRFLLSAMFIAYLAGISLVGFATL